MTRPAQRHEGFSLWIPLLFTAILTMMVAGVNALMGKMQQAAVSAARTQIDGAYQAVIGFAAANRRLPSDIEFAALIKDLRDVHGQPLVYLYDNAFIDAAPDICRRSSAVITVNQCGADANCAAPAATSNVAFAILGGGPIRSGDTAAVGYPVSQSFTSGTAGLAAASTIRTFTAGFSVGDYATPAVAPYVYDDEMRFADVATLRQKSGCQGHQVRIVNNELPRGTVGQPYNATVFADGGVGAPPYVWCVETTSAASTGNLPPGIVSGAPVRNPAGAGTSCMNVNPLARGSWFSNNSLNLTGTPTAAGTYAVIYYVRDSNSVTPPGTLDNNASKRLTITIADTAGCPAGQTISWTAGGANCSATTTAGANASTIVLASTASGTTGSATAICNGTTWQLSASPAPTCTNSNWNFEYPYEWPGVAVLDSATVAVGGGTSIAWNSGTSGNDKFRITGDLATYADLLPGDDELLVTGNLTGGANLGSGNDTVKIGGSLLNSINLGQGNDRLDIVGNSSNYIDAGEGNDQILIGGNAAGSMSLDSGDDELHVKGSATANINAGNGNNRIRIEGGASTFSSGSGDDYVLVFGNAASLQTGSGNDIVLVGGNMTTWADLGAGNDYLEILGNSAGIDAGGGNDSIRINGNSAYTNLGAGDDMLLLYGTFTGIGDGGGTDRVYLHNYTTADCNGALILWNISSSVEHVKVSNGVCRGSDFALP